MFNIIKMQFKREFWENKAILVFIPGFLSILVVSLLALSALFFSLTDQVYFKINGELGISSAAPKTEWIFDGANPEDLSSLSDVEYTFSEDDQYSGEEQTSKPRRSEHVYAYKIRESFRQSVLFDYLLFLPILVLLSISLYNDRKDQSIFFWRSLPISELQNILTKFAMSLVALPFIYYLFFYVTLLICVGIISLVEMSVANGANLQVTSLLYQYFLYWLGMFKSTIFKLVWFLPFFSWVFFGSAISKYSPFILVFLMPIAVITFEGVAFRTSYIFDFLGDYMKKGFDSALDFKLKVIWSGRSINIDYEMMSYGLVVSVILLVATIYVRRWKIS